MATNHMTAEFTSRCIQSVPMHTEAWSLILTNGEVYLKQHYMM